VSRTCRWASGRWWLVGYMIVAWALRLPPAWQNRFHPDEALYAFWGLLIGRGGDPLLASAPVYKPPIFPYLVAGSQILFGDSELAVRYVGLVAGILTVPLTASLARALYGGHRSAAFTGLFVSLSPFAILFSGTAFPDPLMVVLGLAACLCAVRGRGAWAGFLVGLSFAVKQTGLVWMPLALLLGLIYTSGGLAYGLRFLAAFTMPVGLAAVWDGVRIEQGAVSFWKLGIAGYGGLRLIWSQELWQRLCDWLGLLRFLFISPAINGLLVFSVPMLAVKGVMDNRTDRRALTDLVLVMFAFAYFLLHWLWAFQIWDRYLLPLVPVLGLLLVRFLGWFLDCLTRWSGLCRRALSAGMAIALMGCLLLPAVSAAQSLYPVGGDHGTYDGIGEVAAFLGDQPEGTVVYQHWLGWHYAYYLFDAQLFVAYWPTPDWLARDVEAFGDREARYITFPSWESVRRVADALEEVGYKLSPVLITTRRDGTRSFTVYRILPLQ